MHFPVSAGGVVRFATACYHGEMNFSILDIAQIVGKPSFYCVDNDYCHTRVSFVLFVLFFDFF